MVRKYPHHHTFRATPEIQTKLEYLLESTQYNKSFLIRECIEFYFDSICGNGWFFVNKYNFLGGYTIAKKPTKKELEERERQIQAERLHNKRADSKKLLIENLSTLRNTLRHSKQIKSNISRNLHLGISSYKAVYELADEIQDLNHKLEDFL